MMKGISEKVFLNVKTKVFDINKIKKSSTNNRDTKDSFMKNSSFAGSEFSVE